MAWPGTALTCTEFAFASRHPSHSGADYKLSSPHAMHCRSQAVLAGEAIPFTRIRGAGHALDHQVAALPSIFSLPEHLLDVFR